MIFEIIIGLLSLSALYVISYLLYARYKEKEWKRNNPDDPWHP